MKKWCYRLEHYAKMDVIKNQWVTGIKLVIFQLTGH